MKNFRLIPIMYALALSGCAATNQVDKINVMVDDGAEQAEVEFSKGANPNKISQVFIRDDAWIPSSTIEIKKEKTWPEGDMLVTVRGEFHSLAEVAGEISSLSDIKIDLAPELFSRLNSAQSTSNNNPSLGVSAAPSSPMMPQGRVSRTINLDYSGTLASLLNMLSAREGFYWEPIESEAGIRFYRLDTKTWRISALAGQVTQSNKVINGESNSSVDVDSVSIWLALDDAITSMLSKSGKVVVSEALRTVSVTDSPLMLARVDNFIKKQNKSLGKTVLLKVKTFIVELNESEDYGVDWDAIYKSIGQATSGLSAGLSSTGAAIPNAANLSLGIIGSSTEWNGTQMLFKALSKRGKISNLTSTSHLTLNGQPVPFKVGKSTAYLKSSETTITNGVASTASTQGVAEEGYFLNMTPHVLNSNQELLLQFAMSIKKLDRLNTISTNGSIIQTPETSTQEMLQRVRLKNGDTLIVTGYDISNLQSGQSGVGKPENFVFGGGSASSNNRKIMVSLIQPIIGGE